MKSTFFGGGPVTAVVIPLRILMRFRLSTFLLAFALASVSFGWGVSEWRNRTSTANEYVVASEFARFNAYNDIYRLMDASTLSPQQAEMRRRLLQNTVKSTPYLLALPIPNRHQILSYEYDAALNRIASEALTLLQIQTPQEFEAAIIAEGEFGLLDWDVKHPDKKLLVQVLDPSTKKLTPEFVAYLKTILEMDFDP